MGLRARVEDSAWEDRGAASYPSNQRSRRIRLIFDGWRAVR